MDLEQVYCGIFFVELADKLCKVLETSSPYISNEDVSEKIRDILTSGELLIPEPTPQWCILDATAKILHLSNNVLAAMTDMDRRLLIFTEVGKLHFTASVCHRAEFNDSGADSDSEFTDDENI